MPLIIPNNLPAASALSQENIITIPYARAIGQDIRPLRILVVNLMPTKVATETQLARVLANSPLQVELTLLHMDSHVSKNTDNAHLESFYRSLPEVKDNRFDGMIVTGAPVESLDYKDVDYWSELEEIFEYAKENVFSCFHICWGAQAHLYYKHGIRKSTLENKLFGVFQHDVIEPYNELVRGFDEIFYAPHSRHTTIEENELTKLENFKILAKSNEAGVHLACDNNMRCIYMFGHQEYDRETLGLEYNRDISKGLQIDVPKNYYLNDDPTNKVLFRWRSHASLLFNNWLNFVYQETPYYLSELKPND